MSDPSAAAASVATFRCAACGSAFEKEWSDAEAAAQALALFGIPDVKAGDVAQVCDDCFKRMFPNASDDDAGEVPTPPAECGERANRAAAALKKELGDPFETIVFVLYMPGGEFAGSISAATIGPAEARGILEEIMVSTRVRIRPRDPPS